MKTTEQIILNDIPEGTTIKDTLDLVPFDCEDWGKAESNLTVLMSLDRRFRLLDGKWHRLTARQVKEERMRTMREKFRILMTDPHRLDDWN